MIFVLITIIIIAIALFVSTFFMSDKVQEIEDQLEQFSIATMQDTYQLKKKLKVIEEELLSTTTTTMENRTSQSIPKSVENKPLLVQKIHHLHEQGYSLSDIAKETNLTNHDVQTILNHQM